MVNITCLFLLLLLPVTQKPSRRVISRAIDARGGPLPTRAKAHAFRWCKGLATVEKALQYVDQDSSIGMLAALRAPGDVVVRSHQQAAVLLNLA
ncbi:hypothetical protein D3C85_1084240 [compost metagenome]